MCHFPNSSRHFHAVPWVLLHQQAAGDSEATLLATLFPLHDQAENGRSPSNTALPGATQSTAGRSWDWLWD